MQIAQGALPWAEDAGRSRSVPSLRRLSSSLGVIKHRPRHCGIAVTGAPVHGPLVIEDPPPAQEDLVHLLPALPLFLNVPMVATEDAG